MYVSMSRLRVAASESGALIDAFRGRAHLVDEAPGFVDLEVWRSDRDPDEVIMVSRWRDRDCCRQYMRSRGAPAHMSASRPTCRRRSISSASSISTRTTSLRGE